MTTLLENFLCRHQTITLSGTVYGRDFQLGDGVKICTTPSQRLQSFIDLEGDGSSYRFIAVGKLMSFKVVEDPVCVTNYENYFVLT